MWKMKQSVVDINISQRWGDAFAPVDDTLDRYFIEMLLCWRISLLDVLKVLKHI